MSVDIGTINFTVNNSLCYLWQYDNATNLKALMQLKDDFLTINVQNFWEDFFSSIFNIKTADSFGLDLWGVTLGVSRPQYTNSNDEIVPFSDDMYRKLLLARILKYNINGSVASINDYLNFVFENQSVALINNYDMTVRIMFYSSISPEDLAVIESEDFIPLPTGVKIDYQIIPKNTTFGFDGSTLTGFDTGTFIE
jgi:hypothetical protein